MEPVTIVLIVLAVILVLAGSILWCVGSCVCSTCKCITCDCCGLV